MHFTFHFHALQKAMATHSSVLAWQIPGMGESGGLPSMGSHRVGHDWSDLAAAAAVENKVHDKYNVLEPSWNHPSRLVYGKIVFVKLTPGVKKARDHCFRQTLLFPPPPTRYYLFTNPLLQTLTFGASGNNGKHTFNQEENNVCQSQN